MFTLKITHLCQTSIEERHYNHQLNATVNDSLWFNVKVDTQNLHSKFLLKYVFIGSTYKESIWDL